MRCASRCAMARSRSTAIPFGSPPDGQYSDRYPEARRNFWNISSGGPGSGLFRSTDGGDTWQEISKFPGLPSGMLGKIGVAVSPVKAGRVWALIEAEGDKTGLYRSDDLGARWTQVSANRDLMHRPWYYTHVFADPGHADTVYVTNLQMWKSTDGGTTWTNRSLKDDVVLTSQSWPDATHGYLAGEFGTVQKTEDGGATWTPFSYINDDPPYIEWMGSVQDGTPDGPKLHSIIVDPRDHKHLYFGMSGGGVHESTDGGKTFVPLIKGMETVDGFDASVVTYHDPHCIRQCPGNPDRLYQQNHCGIYRIDRPSNEWVRIGKTMPKKVGDVGFPMVVHPRNADIAWVFPMDGQTVWPRTAIEGKPAAYVTRNGGKTWKCQIEGLPVKNAWWTVKRRAMAADSANPVGVYFGTTSGEVWASRPEGEKWTVLAQHLPEIYAVETAEIG